MDTTKKTDNLPATPADEKDLMARLAEFGITRAPENDEEMQAVMQTIFGFDFKKMQEDPMSFFRDTLAQKKELEKLRTDMALIMRVALDFIDVFGLLNAEKTGIRETIISGQEEPMAPILEQIIQIATIDAPMAKFSKRKREEMEQRFAFLGYMGLIVGKYPPAPKTIYADLKAAQQQP